MDIIEPHDTHRLIGHKKQEQYILSMWKKGKLPHAFLFSGPRGIGKATFAFRFSRFLLYSDDNKMNGQNGLDFSQEDTSQTLDIPNEANINRQISNNAHPKLLVIQRSENIQTKKLRNEIVIDDLRSLKGFLNLKASDAGWRVVIIDTIDDMNRNTANAILKLLEEPPKKVVFILISNGGMLLPTITSRCHLLKFLPLSKDDLASALEPFSDISKQSDIDIIHQLSGGSIRLAKEMITLDLLENLTDIMDLLSRSWPLSALDIDTIFEKWQRSLRRNQSLSLEDKLVIVINWLSEGLVKFNKVSDKYVARLKNEDLIFNKLVEAHGMENFLYRLKDAEVLARKSKALNLDQKETFFGCIQLLTE